MVKKMALLLVVLGFCLLLYGCCNHSYEQVEFRKATCREEGIDSKRCTKCNQVWTAYQGRFAHLYKRTEPETGIALFTCVVCGDSYTEEISEVPAETEATEEAIKETVAPKETASSPKTETQNVEETVTANTSHNYKLQDTKASTCTAEGSKTWYCDHCGDIKIQSLAALGHNYSEKRTEAPGCVKAGKQLQTCTICGHSREEIMESLGHDYSLVEVTKAAACTTTGVQKVTCARCGDSYTQEINATGHDVVAASCEKASYCRKCNVELAPPLGHTTKSGICGNCGKRLENPQLEAEAQRHALAVEAINREIDQEILANQEAAELLKQSYGIEELLSREAYENGDAALLAQIESVEQQLLYAQDAAERQNLEQQRTTLVSERRIIAMGLRVVGLLEKNQALEEKRQQRLAEENRRHEENVKAIEKQYS